MTDGYWIGPYGVLISNELTLINGIKENTLIDKNGKITTYVSYSENKMTYDYSKTLSEKTYRNKYATFYPQTGKWYARDLTPDIIEIRKKKASVDNMSKSMNSHSECVLDFGNESDEDSYDILP